MDYQEILEVFLALGGIALFVFIVIAILSIIPAIIILIAQIGINRKANRPGWAAIIPYYSQYVKADIGGNTKHFWPFLIASLAGGFINSVIEASENENMVLICSLVYIITTIVALVYRVKMDYNLALAFGKNGAFTAGLVLLPVIFYPILAWGPSQYMGNHSQW